MPKKRVLTRLAGGRAFSIRAPATKACQWGDDNVLRVGEHAGVIWLWRFPELLEWPREVTWLFCPGNSKTPWPGDLWGVDDDGQLILVEAKKTGHSCDPFEDFVPHAEQPCQFETPDRICAKWKRHYAVELDRIANATPPGVTVVGVLPSSSKRRPLAKWPQLYDELTHIVRDPDYARCARARLAKYAATAAPAIHYVGLFVCVDECQPNFSAAGLDHYERLCAVVTPNRVHCAAVRATRGGISDVVVEGYRLRT